MIPLWLQLREEKIDLENTLEAESEAHVNRLQRELQALRLAQAQNAPSSSGSHRTEANGSISASPEARLSMVPPSIMGSRAHPSMDAMLEALGRENEQLRNRLMDTERDYIKISRLNEIYREELIDHRRRVGCLLSHLVTQR